MVQPGKNRREGSATVSLVGRASVDVWVISAELSRRSDVACAVGRKDRDGFGGRLRIAAGPFAAKDDFRKILRISGSICSGTGEAATISTQMRVDEPLWFARGTLFFEFRRFPGNDRFTGDHSCTSFKTEVTKQEAQSVMMERSECLSTLLVAGFV
jgi:hypothetical protein